MAVVCGELILHFNSALFHNIIPVTNRSGERFIGKIYDTQDLKAYCQLENETHILQRLMGEKIVKLYKRIDGEESTILVLERMDGDLLDLVTAGINEEVAFGLFLQTCECTKYCHDRGIAHLDIKPENMLYNVVDGKYKLKLTDFGGGKSVQHTSGIHGTIQYCAPEVFLRPYDTKKADVWSLGILLHILLTGCWPYSQGEEDIKEMIQKGDLHTHTPTKYDPLIRSMLHLDPLHRPNIDEILLLARDIQTKQPNRPQKRRRLFPWLPKI